MFYLKYIDIATIGEERRQLLCFDRCATYFKVVKVALWNEGLKKHISIVFEAVLYRILTLRRRKFFLNNINLISN